MPASVPCRIALATALFLAAGSFAGAARADVSSWIFVGYGPATIDDGNGFESESLLSLETGMGTPATSPIVFGGMFKLGTYFTRGTDLGLSLRTATKGFVLGDWGAALDLGGYDRLWETGSLGGQGSLVLGAPWGIQLQVSGGLGTNDHRHASVVLGFDFARLTVFRRSGQSWFMNPYPAVRE